MAVGDRIQRFEVIGVLGEGGMGSVVRARDPRLDRDVAIKLLIRPDAKVAPRLSEHATIDLRSDSPASTDDLMQEARIMARLSHPNVLPVYEVGLADDAVFVVMECIEGCDLRAWLETPRTVAAILDMFSQVALGLAAAHARDIVHGDVKPANVLVGNDGRARVADFGLSRLLARSSNAMLRVDPSYGTPHYMAPELWRGEAATKASDVYAFCIALAEAFGAKDSEGREKNLRELTPRLRALVAAGLLDDPQRRPELTAILAALAGRAPRRRAWLAIAAGLAATIAVATTVMRVRGGSRAASCDGDSGLAKGHWDDARRRQLTRLLPPAAETAWSREAVAHIVARLDGYQQDIERAWRASCEEAHTGKLADAQLAIRRACLDRRELELAARIDQLSDTSLDLHRKLELAQIAPIDDCRELTAPTMGPDRAAVAALYQRFLALDVRDNATKLAQAAAIEHDAAGLGERELEARAALAAGVAQREVDQVSSADATMKRAYRMFVDIHAIREQAVVLVERSRTANKHGDSREAMSLAQLALDLVDRDETNFGTRAYIYENLGEAALQRGEAVAALDKLEQGLVFAAKDGHRQPSLEASLRIEHARALGSIEGKLSASLLAAREAAEWTRAAIGEHSFEYASALRIVSAISQALGDDKGALAAAKLALGVTIESSPPGDPRIDSARRSYANALDASGHFEEARREYADQLANAQHSESLHAALPLLTFRTGQLTCKVGRCDEGIPMMERAIELGSAQYGPDHSFTQQYRSQMLGTLIDIGQLGKAEQTLTKLEASYVAGKASPRSLITLRGLSAAEIAIKRGDPRKAERLLRIALAEWADAHGEVRSRGLMLATLGSSLVEQRRWKEASEVLASSLEILKEAHAREDLVADLEIDIARAEAGLGKKDEALARAKRCRQILDHYPLEIDPRKNADRLIAQLSATPSP